MPPSTRASWLSRFFGKPQPVRRHAAPRRLEVESLEDRLTPAGAILISETEDTALFFSRILPNNPSLQNPDGSQIPNTRPTIAFFPLNGAVVPLSVNRIRSALENGFDVIVTSSATNIPGQWVGNGFNGVRTCTPGDIIWEADAEEKLLDFDGLIHGTQYLSLVLGTDNRTLPACGNIPGIIELRDITPVVPPIPSDPPTYLEPPYPPFEIEAVIFDSNPDTIDNLHVILDTLSYNASYVEINSMIKFATVEVRSGLTYLFEDIVSNEEDPVNFRGNVVVFDDGPDPNNQSHRRIINTDFDNDGVGANVTFGWPENPTGPSGGLIDGYQFNSKLEVISGVGSTVQILDSVGVISKAISGFWVQAGRTIFDDLADVELNHHPDPAVPTEHRGIMVIDGDLELVNIHVVRTDVDDAFTTVLDITYQNGEVFFTAVGLTPGLDVEGDLGSNSTLTIRDFSFTLVQVPGSGPPMPAFVDPTLAIDEDVRLLIDENGVLQGTSPVNPQPSVVAEGGIFILNGGILAPGGIEGFGEFRMEVGSGVLGLTFEDGGEYNVDFEAQGNNQDELRIDGDITINPGARIVGQGATADGIEIAVLSIEPGTGVLTGEFEGTTPPPLNPPGVFVLGSDAVTAEYDHGPPALTGTVMRIRRALAVDADPNIVTGLLPSGQTYTIRITGGAPNTLLFVSRDTTNPAGDEVFGIVVRNATKNTVLHVSVSGGETIDVQRIGVTGKAISIVGKQMNVTDAVQVLNTPETFTPGGFLKRLAIRDMSGRITAEGKLNQQTVITGQAFENVDIRLQNRLKKLIVADYADTDSTKIDHLINVKSIGSFRSVGNLSRGLTGDIAVKVLAESPPRSGRIIGNARAAGQLSGTWDVFGTIGTVRAGNTDAFFAGGYAAPFEEAENLDGIKAIRSLNLGDVNNVKIDVDGTVRSVIASHTDLLTLEAIILKNIKVETDVLRGNWNIIGNGTTAYALGKGVIGGSMIDTEFRTEAGGVREFIVKQNFADNKFYVAHEDSLDPDEFFNDPGRWYATLGTFATVAPPPWTLRKFVVNGSFENSVVAAPNFGHITLRNVVIDNGQREFGLKVADIPGAFTSNWGKVKIYGGPFDGPFDNNLPPGNAFAHPDFRPNRPEDSLFGNWAPGRVVPIVSPGGILEQVDFRFYINHLEDGQRSGIQGEF